MGAVRSFHFEAQGEIAFEGADAPLPIFYSGDVSTPDRARGTLRIAISAFLLEIGTVIVGDTLYYQDAMTLEWSAVKLAPDSTLNIAELIGLASAAIQDARIEGEDAVEGTPAVRVGGAVYAPERLDIALWIGSDDDRVYRVDVSGPVSMEGFASMMPGGSALGGRGNLDMTVTLSAFDAPIVIEAPPTD